MSASTNSIGSQLGLWIAYDRDAEGHCIEADGGNEHDDKDDPDIHKLDFLEMK